MKYNRHLIAVLICILSVNSPNAQSTSNKSTLAVLDFEGRGINTLEAATLTDRFTSATLMPIIERKVVPDSIVYSDGWKGYNVLDVSDFHHFRINHSELFVDNQTHINGIENFWNQAKRHMRKFNGVPKAHFGLFLKECEWRFNNSDPSNQLSQLRQWVKGHMG